MFFIIRNDLSIFAWRRVAIFGGAYASAMEGVVVVRCRRKTGISALPAEAG
jgi:hypothetical protein